MDHVNSNPSHEAISNPNIYQSLPEKLDDVVGHDYPRFKANPNQILSIMAAVYLKNKVML